MRRPVKRKTSIEPDRKYNSFLIAKFVNRIMKNGKKTVAERIVYTALDKAEKQTKKPALEFIDAVIENAGPQVELRSRRVGGANYQVPYEVKADRKISLALRWIIEAAQKTKGKPMSEKLFTEMMSAYNNEGNAIKKRNDTHRMAEANKAFAHFAW